MTQHILMAAEYHLKAFFFFFFLQKNLKKIAKNNKRLQDINLIKFSAGLTDRQTTLNILAQCIGPLRFQIL